jgi:hypothetical protein
VADDIVEPPEYDTIASEPFNLKRRKPEFQSIVKVLQSDKGSDLFFASSDLFKIGHFENGRTFRLAMVKLIIEVADYYESVSTKPPTQHIATKGLVTEFSRMGMDIVKNMGMLSEETYVNTITQEVAGRLNSTINTRNLTISDGTRNGTVTVIITNGGSNSMSMLLPSEFTLMERLEAGYIKEYCMPVLEYMRYRKLFSGSYVLNDYYTIGTSKAVVMADAYAPTPFVKADWNYQIMGDVYLGARVFFCGMVLASLKRDLAVSLLSVNPQSLPATLAADFGNTVTKSSWLKTASAKLSTNFKDTLIYKILTVMVMGRWVRLTDGRTTYDRDLARLIDCILRRATTCIRFWEPLQVRVDMIFLIVHLIMPLDTRAADHADDYSVPKLEVRPEFDLIGAVIMKGSFASGIQAALFDFFSISKNGSGYLGAGQNPTSRTVIDSSAKPFVMAVEIEPVSGNGYVAQQQAPSVLQVERLQTLLMMIGAQGLRTTGNFKLTSDIVTICSALSAKLTDLSYYAQFLEKVNFYYNHIIMAQPATDDWDVVDEVHLTQFTPSRTIDIGRLQKLNKQYYDNSLKGKYYTYESGVASFYGLIVAYDWEKVNNTAYFGHPSNELVESGFKIVKDLRDLAVQNYLYQSFIDIDYSYSGKFKLAVESWKANPVLKAVVMEGIKAKQFCSYIGMDAIEYDVGVLNQAKDFIDQNHRWMGFVKGFYYINGKPPYVANRVIDSINNQTYTPYKFINQARDIGDVPTIDDYGLRGSFGAPITDLPFCRGETSFIDVPLPISTHIPSVGMNIVSEFDDAVVTQNIFVYNDANIEGGYKVKEYKLTLSLHNDRYFAGLTLMPSNPTHLVKDVPLEPVTMTYLISLLRPYSVWNDMVEFKQPELRWTFVGEPVENGQPIPFSGQF